MQPLVETKGLLTVTRIEAAVIWDALGLQANQRDNRQADRVAAIMERAGFRKIKSDGRMVWEHTADS